MKASAMGHIWGTFLSTCSQKKEVYVLQKNVMQNLCLHISRFPRFYGPFDLPPSLQQRPECKTEFAEVFKAHALVDTFEEMSEFVFEHLMIDFVEGMKRTKGRKVKGYFQSKLHR